MKQFFAALKYLNLNDFGEESIELIPGLKITKSQKIKEMILNKKNREIIGILEASHFESSNCFLHYDYEDNEDAFKDLNDLQILEYILQWVDDILKNSWLVKDNCIVCDTAFLIHECEKNTTASSLRLQYLFTNSSGKFEDADLTKSELEAFMIYHDKIESYLYGKNSGSINFMLNKNFSRIGRALLFVKQAREARNLAYKISNYCSALESLFCTDSVELSHKLAERIAFFLANEFKKIETFKTVKKAYAIRSKLTHGDYLDQKLINNLGDLSEQIDGLLRKIINKILNDQSMIEIFDSDNTKIDKYFESIILE